MDRSIFLNFISWYYFERTKIIIQIWKNFLKFNLAYFSTGFLLKTFFSPWRKYQWSYGRGVDIGRYFEVFFSNLISRILGSIVRFFLIIIGMVFELIIFLLGIAVILFWIFLPAILVLVFLFSLRLIFKL